MKCRWTTTFPHIKYEVKLPQPKLRKFWMSNISVSQRIVLNAKLNAASCGDLVYTRKKECISRKLERRRNIKNGIRVRCNKQWGLNCPENAKKLGRGNRVCWQYAVIKFPDVQVVLFQSPLTFSSFLSGFFCRYFNAFLKRASFLFQNFMVCNIPPLIGWMKRDGKVGA